MSKISRIIFRKQYALTEVTHDLNLSTALQNLIQESLPLGTKMVFLCLGSEEVSGDSLGPRVGSCLMHNLPNIPIYGTLKHPLDSRNLEETLEKIEQSHPQAVYFAVDAAQGKGDSLGLITLRKGPLIPGIGLGLTLPLVGDFSLTGVVRPNSLNPWHLRNLSPQDLAPERWAEKLAELVSTSLLHVLSA